MIYYLNLLYTAFITIKIELCYKFLLIDYYNICNTKLEGSILYTKEILSQVCENSKNLSEVCRKLGIRVAGGNFKTITKYIKEFEINVPFLITKLDLTTKKLSSNFEDCLTGYYVPYSSTRFKDKLLKSDLIKYECIRCKITHWEGEKLSLHLDHINGNRFDYRLSNLRLLCPNCHSLTDTYAGKNLKKESNHCVDCKCDITKRATRCKNCREIYLKINPGKRKRLITKNYKCKECNLEMYKNKSGFCNLCIIKNNYFNSKKRKTKINWPDINILLEKIKNTSYVALGKELGVSDNAIRKHLKNLGVEI